MACLMPYVAADHAFRSPPRLPCSPPAKCLSLSPEAQPYEPPMIVQWKPPPVGCIKLNFDGSVYNDGSGRASIGGVIRDCTGRVLAAFAKPTEHTASVGIVEARALIFGLRLALCCFPGRPGLVVEGDDLVLVNLLCKKDTYRRIPQAMEDEIVALLGCFPAHQVQHNYREGNQVADALCREAYQRPGVWVGGLLLGVAWGKARDDALGVVHHRIRKTTKV